MLDSGTSVLLGVIGTLIIGAMWVALIVLWKGGNGQCVTTVKLVVLSHVGGLAIVVAVLCVLKLIANEQLRVADQARQYLSWVLCWLMLSLVFGGWAMNRQAREPPDDSK